jgi:bacterial/archaeal transporter family-2 protein
MHRSGTALALGILVGVFVSIQSFLNGQLGEALGSVLLAGFICGIVALVALLIVGSLRGATAEIASAWRQGRRPQPWHVAGIAMAAVPLLVVAKVTPVMGVAWVTIALIGGQLLGSVILDASGLTPGKKRPLTKTRTVGLLVACVAVTVLAVQGIRSSVSLPLLLLTIAAGIAVALTQTASGHIADVWNSVGAAILTFATISLVTGVAWATLSGIGITRLGQATAWELLGGGLLGASLVVMIATVIPKLGSLVTTLTQVAGQSIGAVAIDLIAPAGNPPTIATYISLLLVCAAVAIVGRDQVDRQNTLSI